MLKRTLLVAAALTCLGGSAMAQPAQPAPPDPANGRLLAERLCSSCHAVTPEGGGTVRADVPSFKSIAGKPNSSPERIAGAIIMPHPAMPGVPLTRAEIRDIIAYIGSLK